MKKILFIINPIAGTKSKKEIPVLINSCLDGSLFDVSISETQYAGHGVALAKQAAVQGCDIVVAVGGDGTVNEIAQGLLHTETALAILPMGSGNGLARHLQIPMDLQKALTAFNKYQVSKMDTGKINGQLFLCTSGLGFDAEISHHFAQQKSRGFYTYAKVASKSLFSYPAKEWRITVDGNDLKTEGILFTVANANQFGNNVFIAPKALLQDGLLDLCVLKKVSLINIPLVLKDLFTKNIHQSRFYTLKQAKKVVVYNNGQMKAHVDGEPILVNGDVTFEVLEKSLKIFAK